MKEEETIVMRCHTMQDIQIDLFVLCFFFKQRNNEIEPR
jgi:hypothetical protein